MNKEKKQNYISEMTTQFDKSEAVIVTHYKGLTVNQLDELRAKMREHGIIFKVTKNRITKLALEKTRCKELSNLFVDLETYFSNLLITNFANIPRKNKKNKKITKAISISDIFTPEIPVFQTSKNKFLNSSSIFILIFYF